MTYIRLIFLLVLVWIPASGQSSRKVIDREVDLNGQALRLEENAILSFTGQGLVKNGTIIGRSCRVETDAIRPLFRNVSLDGEWSGPINDAFFYRDSTTLQDWQIVSNVMKFNEIEFTRGIYFLGRWKSILMNGGDVTIHGNGVRLFLPSDKGKAQHTIWGRRCVEECILCSRTTGHRIEINDLTFSDTDDIISGYGSDVHAEKPLIYAYLEPTQSEIVLNRVHSDGQGTLLKIYNFRQDLSSVELNGCNISTSSFAIEILNVTRDEGTGHLDRFKMDSCSIYRYPNALFCGPVSIVGRDSGTDNVSFTNSRFYESNAGSPELSGVGHVVFSGNTCYNMSICDGDQPPVSYLCSHNTFNIGRIANPGKSRALCMGGHTIVITGNTYNILSKPHPFTELLYPEKVELIEMTDNTINYIPDSNPKGFSCLFSIKDIKGDFIFSGNRFHSSYPDPEMDCLFPKSPKSFEDPSGGKIRIHWQ